VLRTGARLPKRVQGYLPIPMLQDHFGHDPLGTRTDRRSTAPRLFGAPACQAGEWAHFRHYYRSEE